MILTDKDIRKLVEEQDMITPFVERQKQAGLISYGLDGSGYDIRLAHKYRLFQMDMARRSLIKIDPKDPRLEQFWIDKDSSGGLIVVPARGLVQVASIEKLNMPRNVQAFSHDGKSTYARFGIIPNITPIDAGYSGNITFSVFNPYDVDIVLHAGEGITQLIFQWLSEDVETSYDEKGGKYQDSEGVVGSKIKEPVDE